MRVLVTGAAGSIGTALIPRLTGHEVHATDINTLDVTNPSQVRSVIDGFGPQVIYHLAADKHAPHGEEDPAHTGLVNFVGTQNVVTAAHDAKIILASTCKAADPETAYGAAKLIAERLVLNAGGVVCRFYNIRETQGNVFRLWEQIPVSEPIPYTSCRRHFISLDDAVDLCLRALELPAGRYTVPVEDPIRMETEAKRLYPKRKLIEIPRRRGDRETEPMCAASETVYTYVGVWRIVSPHDPVAV